MPSMSVLYLYVLYPSRSLNTSEPPSHFCLRPENMALYSVVALYLETMSVN